MSSEERSVTRGCHYYTQHEVFDAVDLNIKREIFDVLYNLYNGIRLDDRSVINTIESAVGEVTYLLEDAAYTAAYLSCQNPSADY